MNEEHRRFQRIEFDARVQLELDDQSIPGILRDISLKGALIVVGDTGAKIEEGQTGNLTVRLEQGEVEMHMDVQVSYYHEGRHACGLNILSMDVETASHLKRLVELNLGDDAALEREIDALIDVMEDEHRT